MTEPFEPGAEDTLHILDLSGYVFRAYHALPPLSNSKGEPTHAVHGVASMLHKLLREQQPRHLIVALEGEGPSVRKERFPDYKANRKEQPPDLRQQLVRVRDVVEAMRIPMMGARGYEADDVIAALVKQARDQGRRVCIVSADKDLLQLVGDAVIMIDTMRDKVFGPPEAEAKMGVPVGQIRDLLALQGDSSDNIPGVPGVGPKTAQALLRDYGDLESIYAHLEEIPKKGLKKKLGEHRAEAELSLDLVTLRDDVPVTLDWDGAAYDGPDPAALRALYTDLELTRLLAQLEPAPAEKGEYAVVASPAALERAVAEAAKAERVALYVALDREDPVHGELVGIGLAWKEGAGVFAPLSGLAGGKRSAEADVLATLFEDGGDRLVSADVKRDEVALARAGLELGTPGFDVMLASYLLDAGRHAHGLEDVARNDLHVEIESYERVTDKQRGSQLALPDVEPSKLGSWVGQRADVTLRAGRLLRERIDGEGFASLLSDVEIPLAHVLADMERTGITIDEARLAEIAGEVDTRIGALERRCMDLAGQDFNVGSPRQLETILFDQLKLPVIKRTKTARSTDAEVLEELAQEHPLPAAILEHRVLAKLKSTYLDALPKVIDPRTGRVHTRFNQAVAATGRLSSSDPNLQNIPIRSEVGRQIRSAFVARKGWELMSADYSQIELRVLAHLSRDPELCDAFAQDADVHTRTATALFDVPAEEVTREQRGQAKTVNFAVIYGQTQFALARNLGIPRREAKRYIDAFFARYAGVKAYLDGVVEEARETGEVRTILGRRRALPDLASRNRQLRSGAERIARNTPIQGSAADIIKLAMVRIHREIAEREMQSKMLLTVHDELVFEAPPTERDDLEALVREGMENALELTVPLRVDLGWGPSWSEAH